jgi:hypothetical protein
MPALFGMIRTVDDYVKALLHEVAAEYNIAVKSGDAQTAKILEIIHRVILKVFS